MSRIMSAKPGHVAKPVAQSTWRAQQSAKPGVSRRSLLLLLILHVRAAASLAIGGALGRELAKARPVVVHVWDAKPAELQRYAIDDVSMACREAGATAVLVGPELVEAVAKEQELARGNFPGPLPVIADCALKDLVESPELCAGAAKLGASAIGIRYYEEEEWGDAGGLEEALKQAVAAAEASSLAAILLGEFGAAAGPEGVVGGSDLAARVGAGAALTRGGEEGGAPALGCWDGSEEGLQRLREAGIGGVVVKNACRGDLGRGAHLKSPSPAATLVTKLVKAALSKGSKKIWAGAGGTGLASDGGDPQLAADRYYNNRDTR